ncbi:MAG: GNAT family N-acetyltransferase [Myxococcota bacterium]
MSEVLARLIELPVGPSFEFGAYRVTRSTTHLENLEIFRFRYRVFLESGFIAQNDYPSSSLTDEFDADATQIAVRDGHGQLVGVTRFVGPSRLGFHTQTVFDLELPPIDERRIGEFGRLAVHPDHRGSGRLVMMAMLKAVFECMIENRTTHVLAFLPTLLADSFSKLGCKACTLITREPSERVLRNRESMKGYFRSQRPQPVLYDLERMIDDVGVKRAAIAGRIAEVLGADGRASAAEDVRGTPRSSRASRDGRSDQVPRIGRV